MSASRPLAAMASTLTIVVAIMSLVCLPAGAITTDQYLALRRSASCDRRITYTQVEANPSGFLNRVIELRGTVNGVIRREAGVAFLLTLDDKHALLLNVPPADSGIVADVGNQTVRALCRVTTGVAGNVVPLDVLGLAFDGEISIKEQEAEKRTATRETKRAVSQSGASFASRGAYYTRAIPQGAAGDVPEIASGLSPDAKSVFSLYRSYIFKCNPRLNFRELDEITTSLLYYSEKHKVDPRLVISVIIAESDFDPRSTSNKGAMGLGQIMPDEARDHGVANPYDVIQNVRTSINLLRMKLDIYYDGAPAGQTSFRQRQLALAAYNAGAGAVRKYGGVPPYKETQRYVKKIEATYRQLCGVE